MPQVDDLLAQAQKDISHVKVHKRPLADALVPTYWNAAGTTWGPVEDLLDALQAARVEEYNALEAQREDMLAELDALRLKDAQRPQVSIEDTGPILEAIVRARYPEWDVYDAGTQTTVKQNLLDDILPGLLVFVDQINAQLER